jgi:hypothetical protein
MRACNLSVTKATPTAVTVEAESGFGTATMELPMSLGDFVAAMEKWDNGAMVQDAFPRFNAIQREFLMTGMDERQQRKVFGNGD